MVGVSGFIDRFFSSRDLFPTNYVIQADVTRFITRKIAINGGVAGTGTFGDAAESEPVGIGARALHAFGGANYFFTPQSLASLYAGGSYWGQVTERDNPDAGTVVGVVGLQSAISSRASFYVEGAYGASLTKGDKGETRTRMLGRVGVRLRL